MPKHRHGGARVPIYRRISIGSVILVLLAAVVVWGWVSVETGKYGLTPILTGSMRPGIQPGDVVLTERLPTSDLQVGDVIEFRPPGYSESFMHRIISLTRVNNGYAIRTKGDANNVDDPWRVTLTNRNTYEALGVIPLVGYPAIWLHTGFDGDAEFLLGVIIVIAAVALLLSAWRQSRKSPKTGTKEEDPDVSDPAPPANTVTAE